jgi:phosphoglycerate dehydrogenase-like enzyme
LLLFFKKEALACFRSQKKKVSASFLKKEAKNFQEFFMVRVAVLDDWQGIAQGATDWGPLRARAEVVFFQRAFAGEDDAAAALEGFDILFMMRERTRLPASLLARLPKLQMIVMTGGSARAIDIDACTARGIPICGTGGSGASTGELTIALLLAAFRHLPAADAGMRAGRFQDGVPLGDGVAGKTLGLIGLGRIGSQVARVAKALDMHVLAWSANLTPERAAAGGADYADKATLLQRADAVSLHVVLSDRTRGIIGAADLARMKPGAVLVNTSRGPLVDEAALIAALREGRITAALDVFDIEPLPPTHQLRSLPNTVLTPHLGYGVREVFERFYADGVADILAFLDGAPVRVLNGPDGKGRG